MIHFTVSPKEPQHNPEIELLSKNIDLLLANARQIFQNESYSNIHVKGSGIDGLYIGHLNLSLGDLICLWQKDLWKDGKKYYYHLGGSPLSGMSFCSYFSDAKIGCDKSNPSFGTLFKPAASVLSGKTESSKVIALPLPKRKVSDLNIQQLIDALRQRD